MNWPGHRILHFAEQSLSEGFGQLTSLTKKSFMSCIEHAQRLPEDIVEHPHLS